MGSSPLSCPTDARPRLEQKTREGAGVECESREAGMEGLSVGTIAPCYSWGGMERRGFISVCVRSAPVHQLPVKRDHSELKESGGERLLTLPVSHDDAARRSKSSFDVSCLRSCT